MTRDHRLVGRRGVLAFFAVALGVYVLPTQQGVAHTAGDAGPIAPVQRLNDALLTAMKEGGQAFTQRYAVPGTGHRPNVRPADHPGRVDRPVVAEPPHRTKGQPAGGVPPLHSVQLCGQFR